VNHARTTRTALQPATTLSHQRVRHGVHLNWPAAEGWLMSGLRQQQAAAAAIVRTHSTARMHSEVLQFLHPMNLSPRKHCCRYSLKHKVNAQLRQLVFIESRCSRGTKHKALRLMAAHTRTVYHRVIPQAAAAVLAPRPAHVVIICRYSTLACPSKL
jgi:hypothetical protein